jgi:O-antigen/teichoic acid export membrane protein
MKEISLRWSWKYFREIGNFGLPLIPHSIASWGLALSDRLILERFVSLHDLGIYSLGRQFATMTTIIVSAIANAWSPFFMKHIPNHEDRGLVVRSAMLFWGTISAIGLGIALVAPALIRILAAPEYLAATTVVSIIAIGYLAQGLYNVPGNVLSYLKKTNRMALATGFGFITSIILNLILIPRYGIMAAALNVAIAYVVMFTLAFVLSYRSNIISYDWKRIIGFAFLCVAIYTITNFVKLSSPYIEAIVRGSIVSIGGLLAISFLMRIGPLEWMVYLRKMREIAIS